MRFVFSLRKGFGRNLSRCRLVTRKGAVMIGQKTEYDWRNPSQRPRSARKIQNLWAWMRKQKKPFTIAAAASAGQMSPRYVRSYVRTLALEGFLRCVHRANSP